jgi:uncharacterized protein
VKKGPGLLDTGPLVSFLASGLKHHSWTCEQWKLFRPPLLTCEPVLTEAAFLLKREGREADPLFALLERGVIRIALDVQEEQADLRALLRRYRNRPMSLGMRAWFDYRNSTRTERYSPWTPNSASTAAMGTK